MYPAPKYKWKCEKCGMEIFKHHNKNSTQAPQKCPKCKGEMKECPIVHTGQFNKSPTIKY